MRAWLIFVPMLVLGSLPIAPVAASACSGGPANDCVDSAIEWLAQPLSLSNAGATMEAGEPSSCDGATVHRSIWLKLEVLSPGAGDAFVVNFDAPFWATLGAYTMGGGGALAPFACAASWEDEGRHSPTLYLPCTAGAVYWIQIGGQSLDDVGTVTLYESQYRKFDLSMSEPCPFKPSLPTEPRLYAPTAGNGEIRLFWVEPYWDGGRSVGISHYNVYGAATCTGAFALLGTTAYRGYTESGLAPSTTRCYKVTAVNSVGEGPAEPGRSATTWSLPRAPRSLAVAPTTDGTLRLAWLPSLDQPGPAAMVEHRIYRAESAAGPFALLASTAAGATTFNDTGLARGATMHYRVSVVSVVGESPPSASAAGTTWQVPGAPRDVRASPSLLFPGAEVEWSAPASTVPFTHYRVYRASSADGAPTFVAQVPASTTSYQDDRLALLVDEYYEVRAANPAGEGDASSRACSVYPAESPLGRCA